VKVLPRVATQAVSLAASPAAIQVEVPRRVATQAVTLAAILAAIRVKDQRHAEETAVMLLVQQLEPTAFVALELAIQAIINVWDKMSRLKISQLLPKQK